MDDRGPLGYDQTYSGSAPSGRATASHTDLRRGSAGHLDLNMTPDETAAILLLQARMFSRAVERFQAEVERLVRQPT